MPFAKSSCRFDKNSGGLIIFGAGSAASAAISLERAEGYNDGNCLIPEKTCLLGIWHRQNERWVFVLGTLPVST